jgi:hypothetical protein
MGKFFDTTKETSERAEREQAARIVGFPGRAAA